jgi:glyoxylase-like metal-dependent hydrolase (beta-lactamase superfamily II)
MSWWPSRGEVPDAGNGGRTQNTVLLHGPQGSVVVDPGPTATEARAVLRALRRVGAPPVIAVIDTHPHPENVLGNAAFAPAVPIVATVRAAQLMTQRCPACRERFARQLSRPDLSSAPIRLPDRLLDGEAGELRLAGLTLRWWAVDGAHSDADLVLFEPGSGLLVAGGLVACDGLPELAEGDPRRWIAALERLSGGFGGDGIRRVITGSGPPCGPAAIDATRRYLARLLEVVDADVEAGGDPADVARRLGAATGPADPGPSAARRHALNLQRAWRLLETEAFARR